MNEADKTRHRWKGGTSPYWQHRCPLLCPVGHPMGWLGGAFWMCGRDGCNTIYVAQES